MLSAINTAMLVLIDFVRLFLKRHEKRIGSSSHLTALRL
jgi:hypothetical protein